MKCQTCKKEIVKVGRKGRGKKFCSFKCYWKNNKGKPTWNKGVKGRTGKFERTEEYRKKSSEGHKGQKSWNKGKKYPAISGDKHYNWKGGITPIHTQIRMSLEYKLWRKSIFERDYFVCQKYGTRGGNLHPHHIKNFSQYPELRFAIDNGITLSEKAHREFHKKYGMDNNTPEQLVEFLASTSQDTVIFKQAIIKNAIIK
jgi:hypothetical protein